VHSGFLTHVSNLLHAPLEFLGSDLALLDTQFYALLDQLDLLEALLETLHILLRTENRSVDFL
jgi:hypothetical protein